MNERERVIIAGAGPVGLSAAIYLASRGLPVTVLEAGPQLGRDLRASTFHPPTLDMLDEYGITEQVIAQGLVAATWQIRDRVAGVIGDTILAGLYIFRDLFLGLAFHSYSR